MDAPFPDGMVEEITRFLTTVHPTLEPGKDLYESVFASPLFFPLQRKGELSEMIRISRRINPRIVMEPGSVSLPHTGPKVVMEIGSDKGGGLYHWCQCLPSVEKVIACEIRGIPYATQFEKAFPNIRFGWCPSASRNYYTLSVVRETLSSVAREPFDTSEHTAYVMYKIDILFIDGDKENVLDDFHTYLPFMNPNGIVFIHDINDGAASGPCKAFDRLRQFYKWDIIVDTQDTQLALKRMSKGLPPMNPHEGWLRHWCGLSAGIGVIYLGDKPQ
jgi:hypothetical protein